MVSQKSTAWAETSARLQWGARRVRWGSSPFMASALDLPTIWMLPNGKSKSGPPK